MAKQIRKITKRKRESMIRDILRKYDSPADLAYFYTMGATKTEKALIDEALRNASDRYREEVEEYIYHPIELKERLSEPSKLEEKAK